MVVYLVMPNIGEITEKRTDVGRDVFFSPKLNNFLNQYERCSVQKSSGNEFIKTKEEISQLGDCCNLKKLDKPLESMNDEEREWFYK